MIKLLLFPVAAIATLPAALLVASLFGAVTFQLWMLTGLFAFYLLDN